MRMEVGSSAIELVQGDMTDQDTDAVINAANRSLLGGGGVDGAIHRAGGPEILAECRELGGCDTDDAKITGAGRLNAAHVIHAVGPVYYDGRRDEADLLASAYRRSLEVAVDNGIRSVASPSISTGAYGYPLQEAAEIAIGTVIGFLQSNTGVELVRLVLYDAESYRAYEAALERRIEKLVSRPQGTA